MTSLALEAAPLAPVEFRTEENEVVLSVQHVSKQYQLWTSPTERLRYSLLSQAHRTLRQVLPAHSAPLAALGRRRDALYQDFTALQDLSFEVRRGESLGILGRNGAGKSTLLQIIAGTLRPSTGHVEVYGRVAALLELGSGFNPEYTGSENVYLNAAVLGFSKAEVDEKFDTIAAFADIGQFLDQPVKTYSSGMMVRLAFAVQMAVEPTLFIIDEALAVGDIYFQNKCNKILKQRLDEGLTLLLVSHSPASIRALCRSGLVLDRGRPVFLGPSDEAVNAYHALGDSRRDGASDPDGAPSAPTDVEAAAPAAEAETRADRPPVPQGLGQIQDEIGTREILITGCGLFDATGHPCREFAPGDPIRAGFTFRSHLDLADVVIGFAIRDRFNNVVTARTNVNQGLETVALEANRFYAVFLTLAGRLGQGEYLLDFGLGSLPSAAGSPTAIYHRVGGIAAFSVSWGGRHVDFQGICDLCTDFSGIEAVPTPGPGRP